MKTVNKDLAIIAAAEKAGGSHLSDSGGRGSMIGEGPAGSHLSVVLPPSIAGPSDGMRPASRMVPEPTKLRVLGDESASSDDDDSPRTPRTPRTAMAATSNKTEIRRAQIRVTELDPHLLKLKEDQLEELLERLQNELSNLEVRKIELENLDRQLDEDKHTLSDAIRKGVHEKEALRKEIEDMRQDAKNMREQLLKTNKDRQGDEATLAAFQKRLIGLKDEYEDTVWNRVDLEDMLRKLDRDLVIMKNKQAEVVKASNDTAALEEKLHLLTGVSTRKMREASKIDGYRENFRRRLDAISIALHHHSSDRADMAFELEHQRRLIEFRLASRNASDQQIAQTSDLVLALQEDLERAMNTQDLFFSEIETSFKSLRNRCDQNSQEATALLNFLTMSLKQRSAAATRIQKVNLGLERYCALLRSNKQFTPDDVTQIYTLTSDLDLTLSALKEYESVRHIGVDRHVEMEALHKLIDQIVLNRLAMVEMTKVHQTTMKRSHDLFLELARDNQQLGAQLAETVAERKKLEAKLR